MDILEEYKKKRQELSAQVKDKTFELKNLTVVQELDYRISVLETFKTLYMTTPVTTDVKELGFHYQLVKVFVRQTESERKFGPKVDTEGQNKREAAATTLNRILFDGLKRFETFKATDKNTYSKNMGTFINTLLPVWVQYRDTYVNVKEM